MTSIEEYQRRIAELEAEVAHLKRANAARGEVILTIGSLQQSALPPTDFTVMGLEESVLLCDDGGLINYANSGMAKLLGADDKRDLLRQPLEKWDEGDIGPGFLESLVAATRASSQTNIIERRFLAGSPTGTSKGKITETILRFVASVVGSKVQVVVQDVSRLRWLEQTFSRYVAPSVITRLMTINPGDLMQVENKVVTVLFTDLRGFTKLCQQLPAGQVCELLNEHFEEIVTPVNNLEGTVDKLVGDSLMAIFGAPLAMPDHAIRALSAAVEMSVTHRNWVNRRKSSALPFAEIGIGIATGKVVVGNVGTRERMDYTVLGHAVNVASRLCRAAKGGQILTESITHKQAKSQEESSSIKDLPRMTFEPVGKMSLKNVSDPVDIIAVKA